MITPWGGGHGKCRSVLVHTFDTNIRFLILVLKESSDILFLNSVIYCSLPPGLQVLQRVTPVFLFTLFWIKNDANTQQCTQQLLRELFQQYNVLSQQMFLVLILKHAVCESNIVVKAYHSTLSLLQSLKKREIAFKCVSEEVKGTAALVNAWMVSINECSPWWVCNIQ